MQNVRAGGGFAVSTGGHAEQLSVDAQDAAPVPMPAAAQRRERRRLPPPVFALIFIALAAIVFGLLSIGQGDSDVADRAEWATWKAAASFAIAVAAGSAWLGIAAVRYAAGAGSGLSKRAALLAEPLRPGPAVESKTIVGYTGAALILTTSVFGFLYFAVP